MESLHSVLGKLEENQEEISVLVGHIELELRCALNPALVKIKGYINQRACRVIPQSHKSPGSGWTFHPMLMNLT